MKTNPKIEAWLDRPVFPFWPKFTIEHLIITLILVITVFSRFIGLGDRVMSHDEVNHVVPAYTFYTGGGYRYDPVTHGPLQFHLITLSYFLFGDSDFSARVPDALFGIAVVAFALLAFKRYLGRVGSLVAGFMFMISPYMLYYSRYTRNEIYIVFWGMALIWGVLRYLELGKKSTLLFITIITALHFTDKATSYIFTAELLIFLAVIFVVRLVTKPWKTARLRTIFMIIILVTMIAGMAAFGIGFTALSEAGKSHSSEDTGVMLSELSTSTRLVIGGLGLVTLVGIALATVFLIRGIGWKGVRDERAFDLLIMQGTIVLPLLAALPMDILGFNPLDYSPNGIITAILFIVPLFIIAVLIGIWWKWRTWLVNIGVFWGIFILFYTTLFTQGSGFPMGLMGALGYWMSQQGVTRGTQPLYYYALVQIPIYEFLPAFGTFLAAALGISRLFKKPQQPSEDKLTDPVDPSEPQQTVETGEEDSPLNQEVGWSSNLDAPATIAEEKTASISWSGANPDIEAEQEEEEEEEEESKEKALSAWQKTLQIVHNEGEQRQPPVLAMLLYWSVMSLIAFSFAGERMPWLTTHIAMPMILTSGWSFGKLINAIKWERFKSAKGWLVVLIGLVFFFAATSALGTLLGPIQPFQGNEMTQLQATSTFLIAAFAAVAAGAGLIFLLQKWSLSQVGRFALLVFVAVLSLITIRTAYRASYILYDTAEEFLVYAHATPDGKDVLEQVEEISQRLNGGKDIVVAYDSDLLYPYWWYFRDYPNKRWYTDNPTRDLRDAPVILVGSGNYGKIEPVVANLYTRFDYKRLWWPMQAYYDLTFERVWNALNDPNMRSALWQIWFNRNYEPYANLKGISTLTVANWLPSDSFRMYIRKDLISQIWEYGATPVTLEPTIDPYEANSYTLEADQIIFGDPDFQLNAPRDVAVAPDGTLYVADSRNHRILHIDADGNLLHSWGTFGASDYNTNIMAPPGTFNEPWGVAVGPDGFVYVADTWNNRIQKFTPEGEYLTMWGFFGAAETATNFWGPRGVAVDNLGRVYVTDTGNKRVVIFDSQGTPLHEFGGAGLGPGQMDEPVGIAVDDQGRIYLADTWNMRIQVMLPAGEGVLSYPNNISWDIQAWYGDSLDNKPYLAVSSDYHVFVADPIMGRVLEFDMQGNFIRAWGAYGAGPSEIGIVGGIAVDAEGRVWVTDALNNRLMRFIPSSLPGASGAPADLPVEDAPNSPFIEEDIENDPIE